MPPIIPDYVPTHFAQGTSVKYTRSIPDFAPSDGWTYTLYMNGLTQKFSQAGATFDSATFLLEIDPANNTITPGPYRYAERLSNPGTAFVLTQVQVGSGGQATYFFSSFSGPAPYIGEPVSTSGFVNGGNNVATATPILSISISGSGGSFTIANASAVNETHGGAAQGPTQVYDITGDELVINVEPSAASSPVGSFQTQEEKMLAALETLINARMNGGAYSADIEAYHIAGRAVTKMALPALLKLRGMLRAVVWRQQHPGKLGKPTKIDFTVESEQTELPPTWQDITGFGYGES